MDPNHHLQTMSNPTLNPVQIQMLQQRNQGIQPTFQQQQQMLQMQIHLGQQMGANGLVGGMQQQQYRQLQQQGFQARPLSFSPSMRPASISGGSQHGSQQGTPRIPAGRPILQPQQGIQQMPGMQRPQHSMAPVFPNCPQQAGRVFGTYPLHGLLDPQSLQNENKQIWNGPGAQGIEIRESHSTGNGNSVGKKRLQGLMDEVDGTKILDQASEKCLLEFADHFINQVVYRASKISKHTASQSLTVRDISLELAQNWNLRIPGFDEEKKVQKNNSKTSTGLQTHLARLGSISKAKKDATLLSGMRMAAIEQDAGQMLALAEIQEGEEIQVDDEVVIPAEGIQNGIDAVDATDEITGTSFGTPTPFDTPS